MKQFIKLSAIIAIAISSCSTPRYTVGMTEADFLKHNHNAELVQASQGTNVYRISTKVYLSWDKNTKFYYFYDGKLSHIDLGVRQPNVIIQDNR